MPFSTCSTHVSGTKSTSCCHQPKSDAPTVCQVLYDLGVVSTKEPFKRLVSQGMILGEVEYIAYKDADGHYVKEGTPHSTAMRY